MAATKKTLFTIDMTPTWAELLPILLAVYENGAAESRRGCFEELERMARIARRWLPPVRIVHPYPEQRLCPLT